MRVALLAFLLGCGAGTGLAQTVNWTKYNNRLTAAPATDVISTNGGIPVGSAGRADDAHAIQPYVMLDGPTYRLWYAGSDGANWRILHATSTNGTVWAKFDNLTNSAPATDGTSTNGGIPLGTNAKGDDYHVFGPCVIKDGDTYWMWYGGNDGATWRIFCATSTNGTEWSKCDNSIGAAAATDGTSTNGGIPLGTAGRGDDGGTYEPWVIKDGSTFRMWYTGYDGLTTRIFQATSPDGTNWTKHNNLLTAAAATDGVSTNGGIPLGTNGRGDDANIRAPTVVKEPAGLYRMWYMGSDGSKGRIYHATSADGFTWTKLNNAVAAPAADGVCSNSTIALGGGGRGDTNEVRSSGLILEGDTYKMWYTGLAGDNVYRIFHATARIPPPAVSNLPAEGIDSSSASMSGYLASTGTTPTEVYCFWGAADGGPGWGGWENTNALGSLAPGLLTNAVATLAGGGRYYYRFYATNFYNDGWAPSSTVFFTPGAPTVSNAAAALLSSTFAALRGVVTAGDPDSEVYIYWGSADVGTNRIGWEHEEWAGTNAHELFSVTVPVSPGQTYYYRCFASNLYGMAWAPDFVTFTAPTSVRRVWRGVGSWTSATNWTPSGVPSLADDIFLAAGTVTLSDPVAVGSLVVSNGAALMATNWTTAITATGSVTIKSGGLITTPAIVYRSLETNRVHLICDRLTVEAGGRIDVDAKGYGGGWSGDGLPNSQSAGQGPGGGTIGAGSHGGRGGDSISGTTHIRSGNTYGQPDAPVGPGSGGGSTDGRAGHQGGNGGGAVRIEAAGHVAVNGTITADGGVGGGNSSPGSGGAIWIACRTFGGTNGIVRANGPDRLRGGGGGGRIAIVYDTAEQASLPDPGVTLSVRGGLTTGGSLCNGDIGTLYLSDRAMLGSAIRHSGQLLIPGFLDAMAFDSLTVSNGWIRFNDGAYVLTVTNDLVVFGSSGRLELGGNRYESLLASVWWLCNQDEACPILDVGGDLRLTNSGRLGVFAGGTNQGIGAYGAVVGVTGDVVVAAGSACALVSNPTNGGSPLLICENLRIAAGGAIDADFSGFAGGWNSWSYGPGRNQRGAGGYGGRGGAYDAASPARGPTYGSSNAPVYCGSGGGSRDGRVGYNGGNGGGLVRVQAAGRVVVDGTITALGAAGGGIYCSAGSGGGIYIQCLQFEGGTSGVMRVDGGSRVTYGGGGGGRIAVRIGGALLDRLPTHRLRIGSSAPESYAGWVSAFGGTGGTNVVQPGESGTIVFTSVNPQPSMMIHLR